MIIGTIVIPVFNGSEDVERALDSVAASIRFFEKTHQRQGTFLIVVVDDCSTDGTKAVIEQWAQNNSTHDVLLVAAMRNGGAGRARNIGARLSQGDYLWFLDADDFFHPPHLYVGVKILDNIPEAGFCKSGLTYDLPLHPEWNKSYVKNQVGATCIRRACHKLSGGFPEDTILRRHGCEDVIYREVIFATFVCAWTEQRTAHHSLRVGNTLYQFRHLCHKSVREFASDPAYISVKKQPEVQAKITNICNRALNDVLQRKSLGLGAQLAGVHIKAEKASKIIRVKVQIPTFPASD